VRPFVLSRVRVSSIALGLALLFALGGLFAVDRMLSQTGRSETEIEGAVSAAVIEEFLAVHVEVLESIRGLYLGAEHGVSERQFQALASTMNQYATSLHRLWVADSSGTIQHQMLWDSSGLPMAAGLDVDTLQYLGIGSAMANARRTGQLQVSAPGTLLTGGRGFIIIEPVYVNGQLAGFAGETISSAALLRTVQEHLPRARGQLLLLAGSDTVAASHESIPVGRSSQTAVAKLEVPGITGWRLVVTRPARDERVRVLIWSMGLAILGALFVVLLNERRQGIRLAERSSELERLSAELLRANRAKSEFLANVSHELRTPLNAIVGFVDLLRDGVYGELTPRQAGPVDRITSSANHLRQLVDQVLDIAKMAAGRFEMHVETIDLRPFVLELVSEVETLVNERGLNFSIAVSPSLPRVRTDPTHLRQILINLLGNAVKFTPSGGIAVRARLVNERDEPVRPASMALHPWPRQHNGAGPLWIALQVADSGIGIAPHDRERIFEEFEQVDPGSRGDSAFRGMGLGLAISRRLARLLGGDLTVESELGKGSTFTVWLPVDPTVSDTVASDAAARSAPV
jgi:signal transduction histidine kinase